MKHSNIRPRFILNLTTITVEVGFLGDFVFLFLNTCSLFHGKIFIHKVFDNFFSASDIMEAVRECFCFYRDECE